MKEGGAKSLDCRTITGEDRKRVYIYPWTFSPSGFLQSWMVMRRSQSSKRHWGDGNGNGRGGKPNLYIKRQVYIVANVSPLFCVHTTINGNLFQCISCRPFVNTDDDHFDFEGSSRWTDRTGGC